MQQPHHKHERRDGDKELHPMVLANSAYE
jgi:hypothetical protein